MNLWFSEQHKGTLRQSWRIKEVLHHHRSRYQDISVVDTVHFGRMLVLDDAVMTTEKDEFVYHEMISHIGLLAHPNPREICVVGGGDGGTVREVLRHPTVERVVLAEIDEDVIKVCREFFPGLASALDDPRVEIRIGDGAEYLSEHCDAFDAIISDSMDPVGPCVVLFGDEYFRSARRAMKKGGFFVTQCESGWTDLPQLSGTIERIKKSFSSVHAYGATVPTYPSGLWCFVIGSDGLEPRQAAAADRQQEILKHARYYTLQHQQAAFALPAFFFR